MQKGINNKQYLYIIMYNDGVDDSLGVVEVGLFSLSPGLAFSSIADDSKLLKAHV